MRALRRLVAACREFAAERRGVVAAITALLIVPLSLGVGVAVDASRMFLVRSQLAQAVDAAALAAGQSLDPAEVAADARRIFDLNYPPGGYMGATVEDLQVTFDETTGQVEIVAETSMPTAFMQLANIDTLDLGARALVVREQTGLELALVLDVTGSMCDPCTKIAALKQAAKDLIDIVYGPNDTGEDLYVAVVPFAERVKVGNSTQTQSWMQSVPSNWNGCTDQRSGSYAFDDTPPGSSNSTKFPPVQRYTWTDSYGSPQSLRPACPALANTVLPLTASKATVKNKINSLQTDDYTSIDIGAGWGWRVLSERWQNRWGTTGLPLNDDEDPAKAIVIMSDGRNDIPNGLPNAMELALEQQADENLIETCTAMRDAGYVVYTVAFQAPAAGEAVLRGCAGSEANYFASATAADLQRAFRQIAGRLSALRLAE